MSSGRSLPQINLGVQGGIQGDTHIFIDRFTIMLLGKDQWIREMSFTRRPGSGRPRQTSRREDHHIVKDARVQPTASAAAIQDN
ncbi:hypothetical protein TNCV_4541821 [Trichonephila clavipes]|nr:hypothetical protein TNCV_4541821 [Trichonephila clavipes]